MQGIFDWLVALPVAALYATLAVIAASENFFPPLPADTIVALGSFLAARGHGSAVGAFLAVFIGNVAGAMVMFGIGRRYGAGRLERRLLGGKGAGAETKLREMYERYGAGALFLSRFIPGVRAIVPPFAGALRVPALTAVLAIGGASALWYGLISFLAFRVGEDWQELAALLTRSGRIAAVVALGMVIGAAAVIWWRRRRVR